MDVFSVWNTHEASLYLNNEQSPARLQVLMLRQNKLYDLRLNDLAKQVKQNKAWGFLQELGLVQALVFRESITAPGWRCQQAKALTCTHQQKKIHVQHSLLGQKYFTSVEAPRLSLKLQVVDFWPEVKNPHKAFRYFSL